METTIRYILFTAIRDWLFAGIIAALTISVFLSYFLGSTVMIEKDVMLTEFTSASARAVLIVGMIVFVCFHVRRAFENKEIELMLSRPISRGKFIIGYWIGFCIVALLILSIVALFMLAFLSYNYQGLSIWTTTMAFEIMIITAFAVFASIILKSSVSSVLLCFGFYITSRMMGLFSYVLEKNYAPDIFSFDYVSQKIIWVTSYVLPRLDLFSQSEWLTYGVNIAQNSWMLPVIQSLIYIPLLLIFAALDFNRKEF